MSWNRAYVQPNGNVVRRRAIFPTVRSGSGNHGFGWGLGLGLGLARRMGLGLVLVGTGLLVATNPGTEVPVPSFSWTKPNLGWWKELWTGPQSVPPPPPPRRKPVYQLDLSWLGYEVNVFESTSSTSTSSSSIQSSTLAGAEKARGYRHWTVEQHQSYNQKRKLTNYGLFSLSYRKGDGVFVHALRSRWRLCSFPRRGGLHVHTHSNPNSHSHTHSNDLEESICEHIATDFCHGMRAFTPETRPFTAYRIFLGLLLLSFVFQTIVNVSWPNPPRHPLTYVILFLVGPASLWDVVYARIYLYPFLEALDGHTRTRSWTSLSTWIPTATWKWGHSTNNSRSPPNSETLRFVLYAALFVVTSCVCHGLVENVTRPHTSSDRTARGGRTCFYAMALGYLMASHMDVLGGGGPSSSSSILHALGLSDLVLEASSVLLAHTTMGLCTVMGLFTPSSHGHGQGHAYGRHSITELLLWVSGGVLGNYLGELLHQDSPPYWRDGTWSWGNLFG